MTDSLHERIQRIVGDADEDSYGIAADVVALGDVRYLCDECGQTQNLDLGHFDPAYGQPCHGTPRRVLVLDHPADQESAA